MQSHASPFILLQCPCNPLQPLATNVLANCLQPLATACNHLQLLATACNQLLLLATACNHLLLLATACNHLQLLALQLPATTCNYILATACNHLQLLATPFNHLQRPANTCNYLQLPATCQHLCWYIVLAPTRPGNCTEGMHAGWLMWQLVSRTVISNCNFKTH